MKYIRTTLLCSAAVLAALGGARAAELPTKNKAANPAPHAKACSINGEAGFIVPGSDACVKISGYVEIETSAGTITGPGTKAATH